jgi:hypothetical protein
MKNGSGFNGFPMGGFRRGGFRKLASLDSAKESSSPMP